MMQMNNWDHDYENVYENYDYSCQKKSEEQHKAPEQHATPDKKCHLFKLVHLLLLCLLMAAIIFLTSYYFIALNDKEQKFEALKSENYNLSNNFSDLLERHSTLQSKFQNLNENHSTLQSKFQILDESHAALQSKYKILHKEHIEMSINLTELNKECLVRKSSLESSCHVCKKGWMQLNSKCYYFSTDKWTWQSSRDHCRTLGGQLVIIENAMEQEFLKNKINVIGEKNYWIGLTDLANQGKYVWLDNRPLDPKQSFWHSSQPNGKNEHCVQIEAEEKWHDFPCATLTKMICEIDATMVNI
ncbi:low affinity immunoglobulin epsilon Fc receptor-like [Erpetoichthys calabaricus]|uniref:Low affinity immunoglobulin epsilon Fc receptor-like n=1 Tax=Erpetoichthys calabaricus TaxID=27687 RepID=A0A8C4RFT3_ERPCA|nr:low affinity immunoglobulin epsilon Fc receptor-like [Erpetoichthys calabaricus]